MEHEIYFNILIVYHKINMDHFDPYNVFLAIITNKPQRLKTGFVVQGHIYCLEYLF